MAGDSVRAPSVPFRGTVLVVDCADDDVAALAKTLNAAGFDTHHARSSRTALICARDTRPDAVILDVAVPGTEDFGLLPLLRAHGVDAPVLFLTARSGLQDRVTGLSAGADDYVAKPFHADEVVARLGAVLRQTRASVSPSDYEMFMCGDLELRHRTTRCGRPAGRWHCRRPSSHCCAS